MARVRWGWTWTVPVQSIHLSMNRTSHLSILVNRWSLEQLLRGRFDSSAKLLRRHPTTALDCRSVFKCFLLVQYNREESKEGQKSGLSLKGCCMCVLFFPFPLWKMNLELSCLGLHGNIGTLASSQWRVKALRTPQGELSNRCREHPFAKIEFCRLGV